MSTEPHRSLTAEHEIVAYLHRTRMAILKALGTAPATASQIATRLGVHPANLTRHMRILQDAGLVRLVEKRDTGRNLEKFFMATARSFDVAPEAAGLKAPHKIALAFARSELAAALARLPETAAETVTTLVVEARLTPECMDAFAAELAKLADRFAAADGCGDRRYHLVMSLHPGDDQAERRQLVRLKSKPRPRTAE